MPFWVFGLANIQSHENESSVYSFSHLGVVSQDEQAYYHSQLQ